MTRGPHAPARRGAFTLVELLAAMAIAGLVMAGACVLMFNTSMAARYFEEGEPFDVHVNGVENFVTYCFRNAAFPEGMESGLTGGADTPEAPIVWGLPPESFLNERKKLCFGVLDDRPFFISRRGFSPEKIAWLDFRERDGLYLVWRFVKNESYDEYDEAPLYESLLSPYVNAFEYVYVDSDGNWTFEGDSEYLPVGISDGTMPNYVRISFERGGEKFSCTVPLSSSVDSVYAVESSDSGGASGASGGSGGASGGDSGGGSGGGRAGRGGR